MKNLKKETKIKIAIWSVVIVTFLTFLFTYFLPNLALAKFDYPMQIKNTYYTIQPHYAWGKLTVKIKSQTINGKEYLTYSPYIDDNQQFLNVSFQDKDRFELFDVVFTKGDVKIASASDSLLASQTVKVSCFDVMKAEDIYLTSVMLLLKK